MNAEPQGPKGLPLRCCGRCEHYVLAQLPNGEMIRECQHSPPTAYPILAQRGGKFTEIGRVTVFPTPDEDKCCGQFTAAKGNLVRTD